MSETFGRSFQPLHPPDPKRAYLSKASGFRHEPGGLPATMISAAYPIRWCLPSISPFRAI
jgi:hypothetical protein